MSDTRPKPPHLASVPDPSADASRDADTAAATGESTAAEPAESPRSGAFFWFLVVVALGSLIAFAYQSQRVLALESTNAVLAGELYSTRTALDAYTERFSAVRETVAGLNAQLDALNALVSEDPASPGSPPASPPAAERP